MRVLIPLGVLLLFVAGCGSDSPTDPGGGKRVPFKKISGSDVRMAGFVEDVSGRDLVVYNTPVTVTDSTRIRGDNGTTLDAADLLVGMWAEVEGRLDGDGVVIADRIDVETRDDDRSDDMDS